MEMLPNVRQQLMDRGAGPEVVVQRAHVKQSKVAISREKRARISRRQRDVILDVGDTPPLITFNLRTPSPLKDHIILPLTSNEGSTPVSKHSATPPPALTDPWTREITAYLEDLQQDLTLKSEQHASSGRYCQLMETRWGLPAVLIPTLCAPVTLLLSQAFESGDGSTIGVSQCFATAGFVTAAIFNRVEAYFQFGARLLEHMQYSSRYADVASDIRAELVKRKRFRMPADVFIITVRTRVDTMMSNEPLIPKHIEDSQIVREDAGQRTPHMPKRSL